MLWLFPEVRIKLHIFQEVMHEPVFHLKENPRPSSQASSYFGPCSDLSDHNCPGIPPDAVRCFKKFYTASTNSAVFLGSHSPVPPGRNADESMENNWHPPAGRPAHGIFLPSKMALAMRKFLTSIFFHNQKPLSDVPMQDVGTDPRLAMGRGRGHLLK